jgi:hypothetical protein
MGTGFHDAVDNPSEPFSHFELKRGETERLKPFTGRGSKKQAICLFCVETMKTAYYDAVEDRSESFSRFELKRSETE